MTTYGVISYVLKFKSKQEVVTVYVLSPGGCEGNLRESLFLLQWEKGGHRERERVTEREKKNRL